MEGGAVNAMWSEVTKAFTSIISLVGEFLTAITSGSLTGILPLFAVGIAISLVMVAVKIVRKVTWGA